MNRITIVSSIEESSHQKDEYIGLKSLEEYISNTYITVSASILDYTNGIKLKSRKRVIFAKNLFYWTLTLRFFLIGFINEKWLSIIACDSFYPLEKSSLINILVALFLIEVNFIVLFTLINENKQQLECVS